MTKLHVNYQTEFLGGGEICAGEEDDAWPNHEPSRHSFRALNATVVNTGPYHDEFEIQDPVPLFVYAVVVHYSTGNTFGRSEGHGVVADVFKDPVSAGVVKDRIEAYDNTYTPPCGYCQWSGYFERIEFVEVACLPVLQS